MVLLRSLVLAATASLSVAHPFQALVPRAAPNPGDELELKKTKNNDDKGTFEEDGDVKLKVGDKLGEGSKGIVYAIDCDDDDDCEDFGPVVLKYYKEKDSAEDERNALAKIDELKAVLGSGGDEDQYTLMTQWEGTKFSEHPKYKELSADPQGNKDEINELLDSAIEKIIEVGQSYVKDHHIYHEDITDENALLQLDGDDIESAALIDWDLASFPPDGQWDDDIEKDFLSGVDEQVKAAFGKFRVE